MTDAVKVERVWYSDCLSQLVTRSGITIHIKTKKNDPSPLPCALLSSSILNFIHVRIHLLTERIHAFL